jgi:hypothetical protein
VASRLLSDDELGYFMDMESLFNHPGWARLSREIQAEMRSLPDITFASAKSWDDIVKARVRYEAIETLLNYPQSIEQRRSNLERERAIKFEEVNEL